MKSRTDWLNSVETSSFILIIRLDSRASKHCSTYVVLFNVNLARNVNLKRSICWLNNFVFVFIINESKLKYTSNSWLAALYHTTDNNINAKWKYMKQMKAVLKCNLTAIICIMRKFPYNNAVLVAVRAKGVQEQRSQPASQLEDFTCASEFKFSLGFRFRFVLHYQVAFCFRADRTGA